MQMLAAVHACGRVIVTAKSDSYLRHVCLSVRPSVHPFLCLHGTTLPQLDIFI